MTNNEFNAWSRALHAHEAHRPVREMACGEPEPDDDPADLAWLGMLIMLGSGSGMVVALIAGVWAVGRWMGAW